MSQISSTPNEGSSFITPLGDLKQSISEILNMEGHVVTNKVRQDLPALDLKLSQLFSTVQLMLKDESLLSKSEITELKTLLNRVSTSLPENFIFLPKLQKAAASITNQVRDMTDLLDKKEALAPKQNNPLANQLYTQVLVKEGKDEDALTFIRKNPNPSEKAIGYAQLVKAGNTDLLDHMTGLEGMNDATFKCFEKEIKKNPESGFSNWISNSAKKEKGIEVLELLHKISDPEMKTQGYVQLLKAGGTTQGLAISDVASMNTKDLDLLKKELDKTPNDPNIETALTQIPARLFENQGIEVAINFLEKITNDHTKLDAYKQLERTPGAKEALNTAKTSDNTDIKKMSQELKENRPIEQSAKELSLLRIRMNSLNDSSTPSSTALKAWMEDYSSLVSKNPERVSTDDVKDWVDNCKRAETTVSPEEKTFFGLASVPMNVQMAMIDHCNTDTLVKTFPEMRSNYHTEIKSAEDAVIKEITTKCKIQLEKGLESKIKEVISETAQGADLNSAIIKNTKEELTETVLDVLNYFGIKAGDGVDKIKTIIDNVKIDDLDKCVKHQHYATIAVKVNESIVNNLGSLIKEILLTQKDLPTTSDDSKTNKTKSLDGNSSLDQMKSNSLKELIAKDYNNDFKRGLNDVRIDVKLENSSASELPITIVTPKWQPLRQKCERYDMIITSFESILRPENLTRPPTPEGIKKMKESLQRDYKDVFEENLPDGLLENPQAMEAKKSEVIEKMQVIFQDMKKVIGDTVCYNDALESYQKKYPQISSSSNPPTTSGIEPSTKKEALKKALQPFGLAVQGDITLADEVAYQIVSQVKGLSTETTGEVLQATLFKITMPQADLKERGMEISTIGKNIEIVDNSEGKIFVKQSTAFQSIARPTFDDDGNLIPVTEKKGKIEMLFNIEKKLYTYNISLEKPSTL
ncbi:MAG: hypothetical protein V4489_08770 [Chlamydiota bacterium]